MKMKPQGGDNPQMKMSQGYMPKKMMASKPTSTASGKTGKGPMSVAGTRHNCGTNTLMSK